jgi:hypothetical protein
MIELFNLDSRDPKCIEWYDKSHARCCKPQLMPAIPQDPPPPPPQFVNDGPYKKCDICHGGGYPSVRSMVINMLYLGVGTCPQYYEWGQRGWIQDRLCQPLQYFAREPCGCNSQVRALALELTSTSTSSSTRPGVMKPSQGTGMMMMACEPSNRTL